MDAFLKLPKSHRITVALGMEDISAPFDIFESRPPPRRNFFRDILRYVHAPKQIIELFPHAPGDDSIRSEITMRQFLQDERLHRLFVQNYDLVGCNPLTKKCSDVTKEEAILFEKKVFPVPIGLDLHTFAGKGDMDREEFQEKVCTQRKVIHEMQLQAPPFEAKELSMVLAFDCNFGEGVTYRVRGRKEVCQLANMHKNNGMVVVVSRTDEGGRLSFWKALQNNMFSLAPFGRGLDTHRLWEILHLRSIPIVLSSPLDRLYVQYPIVIVHSWAQVL